VRCASRFAAVKKDGSAKINRFMRACSGSLACLSTQLAELSSQPVSAPEIAAAVHRSRGEKDFANQSRDRSLWVRRAWNRFRPCDQMDDESNRPDEPAQNGHERRVGRLALLGIAHDPDRDEKPDRDHDDLEDTDTAKNTGSGSATELGGCVSRRLRKQSGDG